jgi:flavin reductase (DIM6/NTAB) family NADH-FMN oxidoreductase RutF
MRKIIQTADIEKMDRQYRTNLLNALSGYKGAHLVGTVDQEGHTNLALFNSVVHIGSNPPLLGFILRPTTVSRHTYQNIKETGYYTINHALIDHFEQAHQTSAKYPEDTSEFEACGFMPFYGDLHPAPYVDDCLTNIGLEFVRNIPSKPIKRF